MGHRGGQLDVGRAGTLLHHEKRDTLQETMMKNDINKIKVGSQLLNSEEKIDIE